MKEIIWGDTSFHAEKGKHWDIQFYPVTNCPRNVSFMYNNYEMYAFAKFLRYVEMTITQGKN
jgi:hypothetical protein